MSTPPTTASEIDNEEYFGIESPSNIHKPRLFQFQKDLRPAGTAARCWRGPQLRGSQPEFPHPAGNVVAKKVRNNRERELLLPAAFECARGPCRDPHRLLQYPGNR